MGLHVQPPGQAISLHKWSDHNTESKNKIQKIKIKQYDYPITGGAIASTMKTLRRMRLVSILFRTSLSSSFHVSSFLHYFLYFFSSVCIVKDPAGVSVWIHWLVEV